MVPPLSARTIVASAALVALTNAVGCDDASGKSATQVPGPQVSNVAARACDILLDVGSGAAPVPVFAPSVRGESIARAPELAISFMSATDAPFHGPVFMLDTQGLPSPAKPTLKLARCYDRLGRELPEAGVTFP